MEKATFVGLAAVAAAFMLWGKNRRPAPLSAAAGGSATFGAGAGAGAGAGSSSTGPSRSQFEVPGKVSVAELKCKEAFDSLTPTERAYAHYVGTASWEGSKICLLQCSWEAPGIFALFQRLFHAESVSSLHDAAVAAGVSEADFTAFMAYVATFYSNLGNYRSFGDSKFVPSVSKATFESVLKASRAYANNKASINGMWDIVGDAVFSLAPRELQFGIGSDEGVSTYYSANIAKPDVELVARFMEERNLSPYNTRLFKTGDKSFVLRIASSAAARGEGKYKDETVTFEGAAITIAHGDYGPLMDRVASNLRSAVDFAANEQQRSMMQKYAASFAGGSIDDHKDASRDWIRDKGPVVESYIGFIESYRDPFGVRGEWEGFVSVVNKQVGAKFQDLVDAAETLLPQLPWSAEYEKERFLRPDFTSLEVIAFGSSGIPAGINLPNYDEIRQSEGFKNVHLGNVLSARDITARVTFLRDEDQEVYRGYVKEAFEVQVGLHELLGHGSGKLFTEGAELDTSVINPFTGKPIATWYEEGQTWDSKFSTIASSYEECRAECVGMFLCVNRQVLRIFGHEGAEGDKIMYANWLSMARAGLLGTMFYNPKTKTWGQAHMQARYAILNVMIESGAVELVGASAVDAAAVDRARAMGDDESGAAELGVYARVHQDRIMSHGIPAIGDFLHKLQVYKATADVEAGRALYAKYTAVPDELLPVRDLIVLNRKPRPMFVQPVTSLDASDGAVTLTSFEASPAGVVNSFVARFPAEDPELMALWKADLAATRV